MKEYIGVQVVKLEDGPEWSSYGVAYYDRVGWWQGSVFLTGLPNGQGQYGEVSVHGHTEQEVKDKLVELVTAMREQLAAWLASNKKE